MAKWPWIERTFQFDFPASKWPDLLERIRGTPARIEERVRELPHSTLIGTDGKGWSIQENIGHLITVEALHLARIEQILKGEVMLVAADMSNRKTNEVGYNSQDIAALLGEFRRERGRCVARFESVGDVDWGRSAMHPRLRQPMRIVDIAYFSAEHDDYHLARIGELIRALGK